MAVATFRAGGLVSGMDTNGIVDKLVELEKRPVQLFKQRQNVINVQLSSLGVLASKLDNLASVAKAIGKETLSAIKPGAESYTDFSVSGTATSTGSYKVKVESVAQQAKIRFTQAFASPDAPVHLLGSPQKLGFTIDGAGAHVIDIDDGMTLAQTAARINEQLSALSARVVSDGVNYYLSVTRKQAGHDPNVLPHQGLEIRMDPDSGVPQDGTLGGIATTEAKNAKAYVDDLEVVVQGNEIKNVIPGVTLTLKAASNTDISLAFNRKNDGASAQITRFMDAFNGVAQILKDNLRPEEDTPSSTRITGGSLVNLQLKLQRLISTKVSSSGAVQALTDLGVKLGSEGSLSLDQAKFDKAIAADPEGANKLFSQASTGLSKAVTDIVKVQTSGLDGALTLRKQALGKQLKRLNENIVRAEAHGEALRERLVKQFAAMEKVLGGFQSIGNFLSAQDAANRKNTR
jgi:flagellar hook-associated protein 2